MLRKLYGLVSEKYTTDNPDSPMHQEILLDGHLYVGYLKEKLNDWLLSIKAQFNTEIRLGSEVVVEPAFKKAVSKV